VRWDSLSRKSFLRVATGRYDDLMPRPTAPDEPALRRLRLWSRIALVLVGAAVAIITLWPGPPAPDGQSALREWLVRAHRHGLPMWVNFETVEFASNVVMFLPIGLFGALALRRFRWLVLPAAFAMSAVIEMVQSMALPERFGTGRDVVANVLGALLGYLLAVAIVGLIRYRVRRRSAAAPAPAYSPLPG
jgi:hypothetical protein